MDLKHPLSIHQSMQLQEPPAAASQNPNPPSSTDAPPKQVALAMERLGQTSRLTADVRLGAGCLLEALSLLQFLTREINPCNCLLKKMLPYANTSKDLRSVASRFLFQAAGTLFLYP